MLKIKELLFNEIKDFDIDQITKYSLNLNTLIALEKEKTNKQLKKKFDQTLINPNSKKTNPIKKSNAQKKLEKEAKLKNLKDWHGFAKKDLTKEDELDLEIIKLRKYLNPKKAYKNADATNHSYIQMGTIVGDRLEGNQGFLRKKNKRQRILEQFKDVDKAVGFSKRKYLEIQKEKMDKGRNKKWLKLKKLRYYREKNADF